MNTSLGRSILRVVNEQAFLKKKVHINISMYMYIIAHLIVHYSYTIFNYIIIEIN